MVERQLHVAGFAARRLTPADVPALQDLFERSADHFTLHDGEPPEHDSAAIEFGDVPPGRTQADKSLHGIFDPDRHDRLIGVVESVAGYPDDETWFLGLLLIDPAWRGRGVGSAALQAVAALAARAGYRAMRLAVIESNPSARRFWERHGFHHEATHERRFDRLVHRVDVLVRDLTQPSS